jgi:hypothetical protein
VSCVTGARTGQTSGLGLPVAVDHDVFCPDCPPARTARALVFSESFWLNALFLVLPFLIVLFVGVAVLRRIDRGEP